MDLSFFCLFLPIHHPPGGPSRPPGPSRPALRAMERFFAGLVQAGAWCCLDEFNRINVEVLSVIAAQLLEIRPSRRWAGWGWPGPGPAVCWVGGGVGEGCEERRGRAPHL